jgi:hypothetical protein
MVLLYRQRERLMEVDIIIDTLTSYLVERQTNEQVETEYRQNFNKD